MAAPQVLVVDNGDVGDGEPHALGSFDVTGIDIDGYVTFFLAVACQEPDGDATNLIASISRGDISGQILSPNLAGEGNAFGPASPSALSGGPYIDGPGIADTQTYSLIFRALSASGPSQFISAVVVAFV